MRSASKGLIAANSGSLAPTICQAEACDSFFPAFSFKAQSSVPLSCRQVESEAGCLTLCFLMLRKDPFFMCTGPPNLPSPVSSPPPQVKRELQGILSWKITRGENVQSQFFPSPSSFQLQLAPHCFQACPPPTFLLLSCHLLQAALDLFKSTWKMESQSFT